MEKINGNARKTFLLSGILIGIYIGILVIFLNELNQAIIEKTDVGMTALGEKATKLTTNLIEAKVQEVDVIASTLANNPELGIEYLDTMKEKFGYYNIGYLDKNLQLSMATGEKFDKSEDENAINVLEKKEYFLEAKRSADDSKVPVVLMVNPIVKENKCIGAIWATYEIAKIDRVASFSYEDGKKNSLIIETNGKVVSSSTSQLHGINIIDEFKKYNEKTEVEKIINKCIATEESTKLERLKLKDEDYYYTFRKFEKIDYIYVSRVEYEFAMNQYVKLFYLEMFLTSVFIIIILLAFKYIYDQRILEENIVNKLAYKDSLTSISNENKFILEVETVLKKRPNKKYAIVYFDVDNFNFINETYSYEFGNLFLNRMAQILVEILGEKGIYARTRNDNFVFLYEVIKGKEEVEKIINLIATKINDFAKTKKINFNIRITNGIYLLETFAEKTEYNVKNMMVNANTARKKIKMLHKENISYYDAEIKEQLIEEKDIAMILLQSLENEEFVVYYQPKVDSRTQTIVAAEALIRWNHPTKGLISPVKFIPIAEKTHDIVKLDRWVFKTVCQNLRQWMDEGRKVVPVSINISRIEVYEADFLKYIDSVLEETNIPVELIEIELTETVTMKDPEHVIKIVHELQKRGLKVSMDDFGTGYSSLAALKTIKLDVLKIDRSFIIDIEENEESRKLVKSVIYMAKNMDMEIVCEGVETIKQVYILQELGCNIIQGYVYHKPLEKEIFNEKLKLQELRDTMI